MIVKKLKILFLFMLFASAPFLEAGEVALQTSYTIDSDWGSGYNATVILTNHSTQDVNGWNASFELPSGQTISSLWNANFQTSGSQVQVSNLSWNGLITPGSSVSFGLGATNRGTQAPSLKSLSGTGMVEGGGTVETSFFLDSHFSIPVAWDGGFFLIVTIENHDAAAANFWHAEFDLPEGAESIDEIWGATFVADGLHITLSSTDCHGEIPIGASHSIAMIVNTATGVSPGVFNLLAIANGTFEEIPTPQPPQTPILSATIPLEGSFVLSWSPQQDAVYTLEESTLSDFSDAAIVYSGTSHSLNVQNKNPGTYHYRISAENVYGLSALSNLVTVTISEETEPPTVSEHKVIGYFPNWAMYRNPSLKPENLDGSLLTHINYAFAKVDTSGNIQLIDPWADIQYRDNWNEDRPFWGHFKQLQDLKAKHPHLKTLISIGGWTLSDTFSELADSASARDHFAQQCVDFCHQYGFDGVDIDWEYPGFAEHSGRAVDTVNFTLLLQTVNQKLKEQSPTLLLTIAAPAGPWHYVNMEVNKIHEHLDWINIMTYDFHGPWGGSEDSVTNHHAALFPPAKGDPRLCCSEAVKFYLGQGVPADKLVLGVPFYGRSYAGAQGAADGLYSAYSGVGSGTTAELGVLFFADIKNNLLGTYERYWDSQAQVPYLFNPGTKEFVSYEDEESLRLKTSFIKNMGLGGAMFWELGMDTRPEWDALRVLHNELNVQTAQ